jgi:prepilin-type N-terminal cleavage/methylation domain-containing protein
MNRRGMTLIELLIGMVLLAMFGVAVTSTLITTTRSTLRALRGLAISRTIVSTGDLLREELGSSDTGEVRLIGPAAIAFRRTVGMAVVCEALGSVLRLPSSEWVGVRQPEAGRDDAMVLGEVASGSWSAVPIVATGSSRCPDGSDALQLSLGADAATAVFVRVAEPVQLRAYLSGGSGWWGLAPASGPSPIQPFAGPLDSSLPTLILTSAELTLPFRPMAGTDTVLRVPLGPP